MPTQAKPSLGTTLTIGGVAINEIRSITGLGLAHTMQNVGALDGNGWGSQLPTVKNGKNITVDCNYDASNAGQQAVVNAAMLGTSPAFEATLPTAGNYSWTFNAHVGDLEFTNITFDGALGLRFILSPDGIMLFG